MLMLWNIVGLVGIMQQVWWRSFCVCKFHLYCHLSTTTYSFSNSHFPAGASFPLGFPPLVPEENLWSRKDFLHDGRPSCWPSNCVKALKDSQNIDLNQERSSLASYFLHSPLCSWQKGRWSFTLGLWCQRPNCLLILPWVWLHQQLNLTTG